jgi:site-specific recombinase XerD
MTEIFSLDQGFKAFENELKTKKLSPATILAYSTDIKQLVLFLSEQKVSEFSQVTPEILTKYNDYLVKKGYQPVSCARKLNALRTFFDYLVNKGILVKNLAKDIVSPKFTKEAPRILTKMEYRALRDTCRSNSRTAALIELFLQTGLKVSEVAHLTVQDVNKDKLIIKKGDLKDRDLPLTQSARKALERYLKDRPESKTDKLFVTKNGTPLLIRNMSTILMRCFEQAEIKNASLNSLRHTWIYTQLSSGVSLQIISALAGHKRISSAAKYLSLIEKKNIPARSKLVEL